MRPQKDICFPMVRPRPAAEVLLLLSMHRKATKSSLSSTVNSALVRMSPLPPVRLGPTCRRPILHAMVPSLYARRYTSPSDPPEIGKYSIRKSKRPRELKVFLQRITDGTDPLVSGCGY